MKRIISLVLAFIMCFPFLGCSLTQNASEDVISEASATVEMVTINVPSTEILVFNNSDAQAYIDVITRICTVESAVVNTDGSVTFTLTSENCQLVIDDIAVGTIIVFENITNMEESLISATPSDDYTAITVIVDESTYDLREQSISMFLLGAQCLYSQVWLGVEEPVVFISVVSQDQEFIHELSMDYQTVEEIYAILTQ